METHKALGMLMYTKNKYENVMVNGKIKKKLMGYKTIKKTKIYYEEDYIM